jgi:hypothetical protein
VGGDDKTPKEPTRKHRELLEMLDTVVSNVLLGLAVDDPKARSAHIRGVLYHWLEQAYDLGMGAGADTAILIDTLKATVKRLRKINRDLAKRISDDRKL